jgi:hypothetical protein
MTDHSSGSNITFKSTGKLKTMAESVLLFANLLCLDVL